MNKIEETNTVMEYITKTINEGIEIEDLTVNTIILADIAKSLAIIADKLYVTESEE